MSTELDKLAAEMAPELTVIQGQPWRATVDVHHRTILAGPDGAEIFLSLYNGRVHFSAGYPQTSYRPDRFTCEAAPGRPGKAVAREVSRKILAGYLPELAKVIEYNATEEADYHARTALLSEFAQLFGGHFYRGRGQDEYKPGESGNYSDDLSLYGVPGHFRGSVRAAGRPDTVTLDLHNVPAETARAILRILAASPDPEN